MRQPLSHVKRARPTRAQASFEAAMVFGLVFLIFIPIIFIFYSYANSINEQISGQQIEIIGNDIVSAAEAVYYLGEPSRLTLIESFPSRLANLSINRGPEPGASELVFTMDDRSEHVFLFQPADLLANGSFDSRSSSRGDKMITLEAVNGIVNISIT